MTYLNISIRAYASEPPRDSKVLLVGAVRHTGATALLLDLKKERCQICILTEAGSLFKSQSGDQAGLTRVILGNSTNSGAKDYSDKETFSDADNSIPPFRAPCLSLIHETTPKVFTKALLQRESEITGELPRMLIFRVLGKKPYDNQDHGDINLSKPLSETLGALINYCTVTNQIDVPGTIDVAYERDELQADSNELCNTYTDAENTAEDAGDTLRMFMVSRAYVKTIKLAALCAVLEMPAKWFELQGDPVAEWERRKNDPPKITRAQFEWARTVVQCELNGLESLFGAGGNASNPMHDVSIKIVAPFLSDLMRGEAKNKAAQGLVST